MVFLQDCCSWVSLLELGRPREGRTVVGRESQKKKEGAGSRGVSGRPARSWLAGAVEAAVKEKKKGKPAGREERKMVSGGGKRKSKPRGEGAMSLCLQNRGWRREAAEGKQKIKVGGRPASVNREREACGRPCSLSFFQREGGGALEKKDGFRVFFVVSFYLQNCPL
jgi:hypothetical protein